jgi:HEAT repeat protein
VAKSKVSDIVARRRKVAVAGYNGDEVLAREGLVDPAGDVRATALGALLRMGHLTVSDIEAALSDEDSVVRRRACEVSAALPVEGVTSALSDSDPLVVEAACFALGERGVGTEGAAVAALSAVATGHSDPLCREAAKAALGAIGDEAGLSAILAAMEDKPAVRRRAVIALAPFEGPAVEEALAKALTDRDWQVRQAAEDLS